MLYCRIWVENQDELNDLKEEVKETAKILKGFYPEAQADRIAHDVVGSRRYCCDGCPVDARICGFICG